MTPLDPPRISRIFYNSQFYFAYSHLSVSSLKTGKAVRVSFDGDVLKSGQGLVATQAAEMLQMPKAFLGPGVLGAEYEFVASLVK